MCKKEIVLAVIGCGRIADIAHFPSFEQIDGVRVKYACDIIPEKAEAAKAKYSKVENAITDYKIALADDEVDAVYVLTPNYAHYTVAMDALRAGARYVRKARYRQLRTVLRYGGRGGETK